MERLSAMLLQVDGGAESSTRVLCFEQNSIFSPPPAPCVILPLCFLLLRRGSASAVILILLRMCSAQFSLFSAVCSDMAEKGWGGVTIISSPDIAFLCVAQASELRGGENDAGRQLRALSVAKGAGP